MSTSTKIKPSNIYVFTTYEDEKTGLYVELTAEKMQTWLDARVYFELYQSDRRTRVRALYLILKGMSSNPKNDFQDKRGRWWSFELVPDGFESTHNLRAALQNLANEITDKIIQPLTSGVVAYFIRADCDALLEMYRDDEALNA